MRTFPAGNRRDLVTQFVQQRYRRAPHATAGAGHDNVTRLRVNPRLFQRHHAQHGGKACGADDHRFATIHAFRHRHQPVAFYARLCCQPAPVIFTHTPAGEQHVLARMEARVFAAVDPASKINTRHHREISDDFTLTGDRQRIFVI